MKQKTVKQGHPWQMDTIQYCADAISDCMKERSLRSKHNTLTLNYPVEHEHELYRAIMQTCVSIDQNHSYTTNLENASRLRILADKYIGPGTFKDADHV